MTVTLQRTNTVCFIGPDLGWSTCDYVCIFSMYLMSNRWRSAFLVATEAIRTTYWIFRTLMCAYRWIPEAFNVLLYFVLSVCNVDCVCGGDVRVCVCSYGNG